MEIGLKKEIEFDRKKGEMRFFRMRHIIINEKFLSELLKEFESYEGLIAKAKIYRACKKAAKEYYDELLSKSAISDIIGKFHWGRNELVRQIQPLWSDYGFGVIENITFEKEIVKFRVRNNLFARTHQPSPVPVCYFTQGFFAGMISEIYEKDYDCVETKCIAIGDAYCEFIAQPAELLKKAK